MRCVCEINQCLIKITLGPGVISFELSGMNDSECGLSETSSPFPNLSRVAPLPKDSPKTRIHCVFFLHSIPRLRNTLTK